MKNFERNDKFFRNSEYVVAGCYAGLDLIYHSNFKQKIFKKIKKILKNLFFLQFIEIINFLRKKKSKFKNIFFRKKTNYIPHKWKGLNKI